MDSSGSVKETSLSLINEFWNNRARLGEMAGTRDLIAKHLEIRAISSYVRDGQRILDAGCGNGITAIEIAKKFQVDVLGIDNAEEMISAAREQDASGLRGKVTFQIGDITNLSGLGYFDLVYTERTLINLGSWESQKRAIIDIVGLLSPGGIYVMCENSQQGLGEINILRRQAGLPPISSPWHNIYIDETKLPEILSLRPDIWYAGTDCYSSTYYFLSRVVNAWLANQAGKEPDYDAPINSLALVLPPMGTMGQGKIWLWQRDV